jgi:hypothetical protein
MRASDRLTRSPPLPGAAASGVCHLPSSVPDDQTVKDLAADGDAEAQYVQAVYHFKGIKAPLDWNLANALMKQSADQGYPPAEFAYAHFAQTGVGMGMDYSVAQAYYQRASEHGVDAATNALIAIENDTVWLERYGRRRQMTAPVDYQSPRRQPDVTFGSPVHTKRFSGQYSPLNQDQAHSRNPLGI